MTGYAFRRVAVAVPTILAIAIFTFLLVRMAPGDPAQALVPVDESYNPQALQIVRHEWGLDKPLPTQFWLWMHNAFEGNLGTSISTRVPVATLTFQRLPVTLELAGTALIVAALVGIFLGVTSAVRGRTFDSASRVGLLPRPLRPELRVRDPADHALRALLAWFHSVRRLGIAPPEHRRKPLASDTPRIRARPGADRIDRTTVPIVDA